MRCLTKKGFDSQYPVDWGWSFLLQNTIKVAEGVVGCGFHRDGFKNEGIHNK